MPVRRRLFLSLLGGGAAWPLVANAQKSGQLRRVGVLMAIHEDDPLRPRYVEAFNEGLRAAGLIEGKTVQLDYRWAGAEIDHIKQAAKEIMAGQPHVVIAHTSPGTIAMMRETSTVPIVFVTVTEPLEQGFVKSLARPGGNVTGFANFEFSMGGKWLQILKEMLPDVKQANVVFNPDTAPGAGDIFLHSIEADAKTQAIAVKAWSVAGRPSSPGARQISVGRQPQDREDTGLDRASLAVIAR
jgi:putative ABC transport system substrate-binding protein